ncbi:hypothetical protein ACE38W_17660 [Chitinophaga sp. Hz27]|uniref:hypothetical protein n=1 Tax=Chitinophaga sp. Hz27 TaxID=3347169 RepID=UPI0035DA99BC
MTYYGDPYATMRFKNPPSWKIVSKNKKQWMKKKFFTESNIIEDGNIDIERWW